MKTNKIIMSSIKQITNKNMQFDNLKSIIKMFIQKIRWSIDFLIPTIFCGFNLVQNADTADDDADLFFIQIAAEEGVASQSNCVFAPKFDTFPIVFTFNGILPKVLKKMYKWI